MGARERDDDALRDTLRAYRDERHALREELDAFRAEMLAAVAQIEQRLDMLEGHFSP